MAGLSHMPDTELILVSLAAYSWMMGIEEPHPSPEGGGVPLGGSAESSCQERGCGMCRMAAALPLLGPWEKLLE